MQRADELHRHLRMTGDNHGKAVGPACPMSGAAYSVGTPEAKNSESKRQRCAGAEPVKALTEVILEHGGQTLPQSLVVTVSELCRG